MKPIAKGSNMRVTSVEPIVLKVPLGKEEFYSSQCAFPERTSLLVRVETDNEIGRAHV